MSYKAEILADSVSPEGIRLTTFLTVYPRFIHSEMLRHRVFSHSVASSRAIPTEKLIEQVCTNPFIPETFNERVKGMGVGAEMDARRARDSRVEWEAAARAAANHAQKLMEFGLDKSRANRLLEPFMWVSDIITATEWSNFFALRDHSAAQPEFQKLARMMRETMEQSTPQKLDYGQWHLPLVTKYELAGICEARKEGGKTLADTLSVYKRISASRCARISFDKHTESEPQEATLERAQRLLESGHYSPFEHVARPVDDHGVAGEPDYGRWSVGWTDFVGNFCGWVQMRKEIQNEYDFSKALNAQEAIG